MNGDSGIRKEWLANMTIAAFEYAASFRIRLESNVRTRKTPNVLYLELRSTVYFGSYTEWTSFVESMPFPVRRGGVGLSNPCISHYVIHRI